MCLNQYLSHIHFQPILKCEPFTPFTVNFLANNQIQIRDDQTGWDGIDTLMLNAHHCNGNNIVLTKMSIVFPVCPSSAIVCWIVLILGFLFDSSSVPKPQLWNVEYGRNASSKLPFRLLLLTGSKADTKLFHELVMISIPSRGVKINIIELNI